MPLPDTVSIIVIKYLDSSAFLPHLFTIRVISRHDTKTKAPPPRIPRLSFPLIPHPTPHPSDLHLPPQHLHRKHRRPLHSNLLLTSLSVPTLFSINPISTTPIPSIIYTFPNATGLSGITEISPDIFALVTGVWDQVNTRAALGSLAIWTVDFTSGTNNSGPPVAKFITGVANSTILNGIVRHPLNPTLLLAADSALGAVWRVDLLTGCYSVAFSDPLLAPLGTAPGTNLGINGLKARGSYLYFTNSARRYFGRVEVDYHGSVVGEIEVISNSTDAGADVIYDDIALDRVGGGGWIASHPSYAVHVDLDGRQRVVNDTDKLLNPTSAAFGRGDGEEERTLYVTNGGESVGADFTLVNEGVVAVDLSGGRDSY